MIIEAAALKLPESVDDDELIRLPTTWNEFLALLQEADHAAPTLTCQFLENEIIMSQATESSWGFQCRFVGDLRPL